MAVLGPKWRIHYYAHMDSYSVTTGTVVKTGSVIGVLGDSGNAQENNRIFIIQSYQ